MTIKTLHKRFDQIILMCDLIRQETCSAKADLERLSAPAPSGVKGKALSAEKIVMLKSKFRKSLIKTA